MMSIIHTMRKVLVVVIVVGLASCGGADERKDKYLEKGKAYLESNNLDKARIEFKNVLQIDPKDAEVYFYMGLLEEKNNEPNKAYGFYNKAHELMPDYVEPKLKLAEIYTVIGGEEYSGKAKKLLNEILLGDSQNTKARLIQQQISYKEGNEEAAIKEIEKLVEEDPLLDNGINLLTSAYVAKGENDKAINLLDKGIAVNFGNVAFRSKKVSILIKEKRFEDAEKELIEIVNLDKSIYASRLALSSFYAKTSQLDKAEKVLREGLSEAPEDVNRALILVQFLISRKGRDHAIDELNNMIAANPDVYELQLTLARIFKDSNENDKAKKIFSSIIRESNSAIDRTHANNLMAEMLLSENDVQGAKAILDEVLEEYTENHNALELRGKAALIEKDYKSAVNYLRTASKLQPDRADLSKILAQAHFYLNEYELAENILMNAIKSNPKSVDSRINYAEYLLTQKRDADAKKVIHDARAFNKTDYSLQRFALKLAVADKDVKMQETILDEMKNTNKDNRDVYINRGNYYLAHNKYDKALEEFNLALERSATPPDVIVSLEMIARVYVAQNKLSDAIKYMEQRIESNSRDILSRFVLANIYLANKDRPNAKKYYMSVIDIGYKWPKPYTVLASIYSREENVDQAIELLKKGIEATDGDVSLKINLAGYYEAQNKFNDAMKVYEEVLVNDPLNMIALNNLASILLDQSSETNSIDRALAYAKKLNIEQNVAFKDTLGWAYAKSGDYKKSIELIKPIADQSPEILIFQYHLGYSLYHNGQKDEAKSYLEKVVNSSVSFSGKEAAKELFKSI